MTTSTAAATATATTTPMSQNHDPLSSRKPAAFATTDSSITVPANPPNLSHLIPRLTPRQRRNPRPHARGNQRREDDGPGSGRDGVEGAARTGGGGEGEGEGAEGGKAQSRAPEGLPVDAPATPALVPPEEELRCFAVRAGGGGGGDEIGAEDKDVDGDANGERDLRDGVRREQVRHTFRIPTRRALGPGDLERFRASGWHELIVGFVFGLADSVRGRSISWVEGLIGGKKGNGVGKDGVGKNDDDGGSGGGEMNSGLRTIRAIDRILGAIEELVEETPGDEEEGVVNNVDKDKEKNNGVSSSSSPSSSRFGKKAFRTFLKKVEGQLTEWHDDWLGLGMPTGIGSASKPQERNDNGSDASRRVTATDEVSTYLLHAFGSGPRLDYGSGHELNFIIWLLCLNRLHLLPQTPLPSSSSSSSSSTSSAPSSTTPTPIFPLIALHIFPRYLRLARLIQSTYYLEPAGSHGVWGLDDHQFLPFLFGAAQLVGHPILTPRAVHNDLLLEDYSADYLYLDQVAYVNSVKTVAKGLRWHSPMLDDISAAKSWAKVEKGMRLMFLNEVLGKVVVMQHFLSGSLVALGVGVDDADADGHGHGHGNGDSKDGCSCTGSDGSSHARNGKDTSIAHLPLSSSSSPSSVPAVTGTGTGTSTNASTGHAAEGNATAKHTASDEHDAHVHSGWGDCCGIRLPSSAGALQEMRKRTGGDRGLRRIPFD